MDDDDRRDEGDDRPRVLRQCPYTLEPCPPTCDCAIDEVLRSAEEESE